jgi:hypothetical protein
MAVTQDEEIVRFVLIEETGPQDVLLFSCKTCPDSKMTSYQLENHMRITHNASKFTVDTATASRNRRKSATS